MTLHHWLNSMRRNTQAFRYRRRPDVSGRSGARPGVESLEDRRLLSVNVQLGVAGLNTNDAGGIVEPPDTIAAAGPTTVVELVNSNIAFYSKSNGSRLFSEDLGTFFAPVDPSPFLLSDVSVTYDEQAGRFFVSSMDIDFNNLVSHFDFAVSNDSNPLDGFSEMHQIDTTETSPRTGETLFTDFPRLGWNADAYVVSFNMFGFQTQNQYNAKLLVIQKSSVLDKNPATLTDYQVDRPLPNSTLVPATMHGSSAGGPMWLVEEMGLNQNGSYTKLRVVKMTNVLSGSPRFTDYYVAVAPYTITPFPSDTVGWVSTALDTRILNVDWRNNQMVAAQDVGVASDTNVHARWYEIATGGTAPALVQQGTLRPGAGVDTYMPSVALGTDGSIGMTYIESSPSEDMSMYVTGRLATDPVGTMQAGVEVKAGEQYYQGTRVGDFSGITVDPTTGTTYWAANEYAIATSDISLPNWGTWIANFSITSPKFTWTGDGSTSNWSDPQNWSGGVAPSAGSNLVFGPSAAKFTSTDDFPAGIRFGSITFTEGGYSIGGNGIVLTIGLDASAVVQVIPPAGGPAITATIVSVKPSGTTDALGDAPSFVVTDRITPPGRSWSPSDNGTYTVTLGGAPVIDLADNAGPTGTLGTFSVSITSKGATPRVVTTPPPNSITAVSSFSLAVPVDDGSGNVERTDSGTDFSGGVTLALVANLGGATLGGTLIVTISDGEAPLSNLTLNKPGQGYKLKATSTGLTSATTGAFSVRKPGNFPTRSPAIGCGCSEVPLVIAAG